LDDFLDELIGQHLAKNSVVVAVAEAAGIVWAVRTSANLAALNPRQIA